MDRYTFETKKDMRIHISEVYKLIQETDEKGKPKPFSIVFVKRSSGEIRKVESCTLTSFHTKGSTINILYPNDITPHTIRKCLIIEFNGKKVYL